MEGYVILCLVFVLLPLYTVGAIAWGISSSFTLSKLRRLRNPQDVEEQLAVTSSRMTRLMLVSAEFDMNVLMAGGRPIESLPQTLSQAAVSNALLKAASRRSWSIKRKALPWALLVAPLVLGTVGLGLWVIYTGDLLGVALVGVGAWTAYVWYARIRTSRQSRHARVGRWLLPLIDMSPQERSVALWQMAQETVAASRSIEHAEKQPGFSDRRLTVSQGIESTTRWSQQAWIGAVMAGGGTAVLRLVLKLAEAFAPKGLGAVAAFLAATAVLGGAGWFGWRVWYGSPAAQRRMLARIRALPADTEEQLTTQRALELVAAAVGLPVAPALYVLGTPVINAGVAGTTPAGASFVVTDRFTQLPQQEQQAALATLMAHVVSGRAAKAIMPRRGRADASSAEERLVEEFSAANELEGLQITRAPQAHLALLERLISGDTPSYPMSWMDVSSPFADRRLWFYVPPVPSATRTLRTRLGVLRNVLAADAVGRIGKPPIPSDEREVAPPHEELPPDEQDRPVPSAREVAARAAAVLLAADRAYAEFARRDDTLPAEARETLSNRVEALRSYAHEAGLIDHLTLAEAELLWSELGTADEQLVANCMWSAEGLSVLLWALNEIADIPGWDERFDRSTAPECLRNGEAQEALEWVADAVLRRRSDIVQSLKLAQAWYWRAWIANCQADGVEPPEGSPYEEAWAEVAAELAEGGWLEPIGEDFPALGVAYHDLTDEQRLVLRSIAWERFRAVNWLHGLQRAWDAEPESR